ncbi:MAG: hypothetical protein GKS01_07025 [Alphaproteobacteria bacterium]|nr:hypothetical protein [Alphaproteobacteria bacterium]
MRLNEIAEQYADKMQFVCVYIREAHPGDGDQVGRNLQDKVFYDQPTSSDERAEVAAACMLRYNFSFLMLLDDMTDQAEGLYRAWPERLYIVSADGRIAYKGGMGPWDFGVDPWLEAIRAELGDSSSNENHQTNSQDKKSAGEILQTMSNRLVAERCEDRRLTVGFVSEGSYETCALEIDNGTCTLQSKRPEDCDVSIKFHRDFLEAWAAGGTGFEDAIDLGQVAVEGDRGIVTEFFSKFEPPRGNSTP